MLSSMDTGTSQTPLAGRAFTYTNTHAFTEHTSRRMNE